MAANADLFLLNIPQPPVSNDGKRVTLIPMTGPSKAEDSSSGNSSQDVAEALAAMTQSLLSSMQKMLQFLSEEAEQNAQTSQENVSLSSSQAAEAAKDLNSVLHPSFWASFLPTFLKILGPVLAVSSLVLALYIGPAAFLITAAIIVVTMIPVHNGQGMLASAVDAAVQAVGKDCGWSPATIQLVKGIINLVVGISVAILGGYAAAGEAVAEVADTAAEEVGTELDVFASNATNFADQAEEISGEADQIGEQAEQTVESAAAKAARYQSNAAKFVGFNTAASTIGSNSKCFNDIFMGAWSLSNPNDSEKGKKWAEVFSMIMNLLVVVASCGGSLSAVSGLASDADELSTTLKSITNFFDEDSAFIKLISRLSTGLGEGLAGTTASQLQNYTVKLTALLNALGSGANIANGFQEKNAAELQAQITKLRGEFEFSQGTGAILNQMTALTNNALADSLKKFDALEKAPNYSQAIFSEARAMLQENQRA